MADELNLDLLPWQLEVFSSPKRFKVVVAGRRCGKTRLSAVALITKGLKCPDRLARVMYIAPTQAMAVDLMWDLLMELARPVILKVNINDGNIFFVNGVTIQIRGADKPDRLRGKKLFYAVLDEMKDMKDEVWEDNVSPSLSDMEGEALFIGTPEPGDSLFRDYYNIGVKGEDLEWGSWHFTTYENPFIKRTEIESAKRRMSTFAFKKEYMASFDTIGTEIFKEEWFKYGEEPRVGDYYIAVDLAGFEDVADNQKKKHLDDTAIAVVKVCDDGTWWVKKVECFRKDVRETAVRILMAIRTFKPISVGIEKGSLQRAVMPYLEDLMRKNAQFCHIEAIPTSSNSKENRVIYALQGMFEHGRITFSKNENHDKLKDQLLMFPSTKAHDDAPDALSMIQHLVTVSYAKPDDSEEYEIMDVTVGF